MILRPRERDVDVLFIKRAEHDRDPWSGHMAFPGGRVEAADADALAAARRETREEVQIDLTANAELIASLDDLQAVARGRRMPLVITPFAFELQARVEPRANHEVEAIVWVTGEELRDQANWSTLPYEFEGKTYTLPCIRVRERVIWGLTYRMLMGLFSILDWQLPSSAPSPLHEPARGGR